MAEEMDKYVERAQKALNELQESWNSINQYMSSESEKLQESGQERLQKVQSKFQEFRNDIETVMSSQDDYVAKMIAEDEVEQDAKELWDEFQTQMSAFAKEVEKSADKVETKVNIEGIGAKAQWQVAKLRANLYYNAAMNNLKHSINQAERTVEKRINELKNG